MYNGVKLKAAYKGQSMSHRIPKVGKQDGLSKLPWQKNLKTSLSWLLGEKFAVLKKLNVLSIDFPAVQVTILAWSLADTCPKQAKY